MAVRLGADVRVKVANVPRRHHELENLVGRVGVLVEERERPRGRGRALRVSGLPGGDVWLAEDYCEEALEDAEDLQGAA